MLPSSNTQNLCFFYSEVLRYSSRWPFICSYSFYLFQRKLAVSVFGASS